MKCLSPDVFNPDVFVSLYFTHCCRPPPTLSAPLDVLTYGKVYKTIDSFLVKVADPSSLCLYISVGLWCKTARENGCFFLFGSFCQYLHGFNDIVNISRSE